MSFIAFGPGATTGSSEDTGSTPVALPLTEAGADENTFVAEPEETDATNRTGSGLGLSGSDLELVQRNGIPAAVDGYNQFDGLYMGYRSSSALLVAVMSQPRWTLLWNVKDWVDPDESTYRYLAYAKGTADENLYIFCNSLRIGVVLKLAGDERQLTLMRPGYTTWGGWIALWFYENHLFFGLKEGASSTAPTRWEDFESRTFIEAPLDGSGVNFATRQDIFGPGVVNLSSLTLKAGVFVASKLALGVPDELLAD